MDGLYKIQWQKDYSCLRNSHTQKQKRRGGGLKRLHQIIWPETLTTHIICAFRIRFYQTSDAAPSSPTQNPPILVFLAITVQIHGFQRIPEPQGFLFSQVTGF